MKPALLLLLLSLVTMVPAAEPTRPLIRAPGS